MKNTKSIKRDNINQIREFMTVYGTLTKPELAAKTGLSVVTINSLLSDMVLSGEIRESGLAPSEGGRRSMQYEYNFEYQHLVIVYGYQKDSKNHFHFTVINLKGEKIIAKETEIDNVEVSSFSGLLDELFEKDSKISMIVFGLPGENDEDEILINDYEGIVGNTFIPYYRERYQVPIIFENDINAMTYGYCYFKRAAEPAVGLYFPRIYAPGAGIVLNGEIYRGIQNFAGEIGFAFPEINWDRVDYNNKDEVIPFIGRVLTVYACTFAPATFVLYGDFFEEEDINRLKLYVLHETKGKYQANIIFSNQLEEDYERGLIAIGLYRLEKYNHGERR